MPKGCRDFRLRELRPLCFLRGQHIRNSVDIPAHDKKAVTRQLSVFMINPFAEIHWNPSIAERRRFAKSWMVGFPSVAALSALLLHWRRGEWSLFPLWIAVTGLTLGALLWRLPQIARPFFVAWHFVGCCVGFAVGNIVFIFIFYLIVTPIGLLLRASGHDPLKRRFTRAATTYWEPVKKKMGAESYFQQF